MAALTVASVRYGVDMAVTYVVNSASDTDTLNVGKGKTRIIAQGVGNPVTQASAGVDYTYVDSTGVLTVYPGENSLGLQITVYPK